MASAIKAVAIAKVVGPPNTATRAAFAGLLHDLTLASTDYLTPARGFGLGPTAHAEHEMAEGFRYLSHITRIALELYVEAAPRFVRFISPTLKLIGDNPDALYFISVVDSGSAYNISGCRNGDLYFSIAVQGPTAGGGFERVLVDLNDDKMAFDSNNCFSVVLSAERPPGDLPRATTWLELPDTASSVVTRQYYEANPPAQLNQSILSSHDLTISLLTKEVSDIRESNAMLDVVLARRFAAAAAFVRSHTVNMPLPDPTTAPPFFSLLPNDIGVPTKWARDSEGMGAVDIAYGAGRFVLEPEQALIITGRMPTCRFANVVLWNRFLQTFDYASPVGPVSLNQARLTLDADRRFTIVLAHTNPLVGSNSTAEFLWTEGRVTGTMFFRFVLPEEPVEKLQTRVVAAAAVQAELDQ
jgi:hypothetical protein